MSLEPTQPAAQVRVRHEEPDDAPAVRQVSEAAFGRPVEANIVDVLRAAGYVTLSMVAVIGGEEVESLDPLATGASLPALGSEGESWGSGHGDKAGGDLDGLSGGGGHEGASPRIVGGEVIGHVLVTPVTLATERGEERLLGLGPVAVLPEYQGQSVGTLLVEACLEHLRDSGVAGVVVVGNPGYYGRFGFITASRWGLRWEAEAPEEVFMAVELSPGQLANKTGVCRYRPEFDVATSP